MEPWGRRVEGGRAWSADRRTSHIAIFTRSYRRKKTKFVVKTSVKYTAEVISFIADQLGQPTQVKSQTPSHLLSAVAFGQKGTVRDRWMCTCSVNGNVKRKQFPNATHSLGQSRGQELFLLLNTQLQNERATQKKSSSFLRCR